MGGLGEITDSFVNEEEVEPESDGMKVLSESEDESTQVKPGAASIPRQTSCKKRSG